MDLRHTGMLVSGVLFLVVVTGIALFTALSYLQCRATHSVSHCLMVNQER